MLLNLNKVGDADLGNTKKVVLSGILSAIVLILLFISSVSFVLDYTVVVLASVIIMVAVIEMSKSWAFLVYIAAAILSLFLIPLKDSKLIFIFLLGYYPIIKSFLEKLNNRILEYVLKILVFNISMGLCIYLFKSLFISPEDILSPTIIAVSIVVLNLTFIIYDLAISKIAVYYIFKIKPRMKFMK